MWAGKFTLKASMFYELGLSVWAKGPFSVRLDIYNPHASTSPFIHKQASSIPDAICPSGLLGFWGPTKVPRWLFWTLGYLKHWTWLIYSSTLPLLIALDADFLLHPPTLPLLLLMPKKAPIQPPRVSRDLGNNNTHCLVPMIIKWHYLYKSSV